jgi:AmmeMemoRadiSam system protein A
MSRLSCDERVALLGIARRAILSAVIENCLPDLPPFSASLCVSHGAFVTLHSGGKLRGCVGQVENPGPLGEAVARAAINAALHDPRFAPVAVEEITSLEIEISILSPLEPVAPDAIIAGQHGLMVVRPPYRGLLLPQVAAQRRWSGQQLLEETCAKAGLGRDAWRDPATQISAFTAEIFSEAELRTSLNA